MNKLAELRKHLAALKGDATKILDAASAANRDLTAEEETRYSAIEAQIEAKNAEITAAEKMAERRRHIEALPTGTYGANTVNDLDPAATGGFKDMAEFAKAVHGNVAAAMGRGGAVDARLMAAPASPHQGGAATGEGYELPPQYRDAIWEIVTTMDEFGPLIDEEPTSAREVKLTADETTPWGGTGIRAFWRAEGDPMTPSKLATQPRSVPLEELYVMANVTEELLEDAPRLANRLTTKAAQAISWKKNDAIIYGSGAGQPLGWMKSGALVTVPKEGSQAADTIVAKNVMKMFSRLQRIPGDKPIWLANSDCLPELMGLVIGDKPVWLPPNGLVDAPGGFLLGAPVMLTEHAKTLGDLGDLQFISPKGYYAARRSAGVQFASSIHLYFDYNTQAFRWIFRYGGQPHLSAPVTPANGSATKSHFVALADRA
ncbi:hypothetical protein GCM10010873_26660 [Cypionkella aquatica]|uniref:Phage capsid-like C-terminal domain-containing protein n=1 Tax=Cypionkella aquatica TaxID=1756042 RepID=A0AA37X0Z8_9RHOB|nr:phage major capsid protein [Cypionkella aquatica]GLS87692.1 hypothetical protein GCM10010873_26660 [Cypionkella aquatica]